MTFESKILAEKSHECRRLDAGTLKSPVFPQGKMAP